MISWRRLCCWNGLRICFFGPWAAEKRHRQSISAIFSPLSTWNAMVSESISYVCTMCTIEHQKQDMMTWWFQDGSKALRGLWSLGRGRPHHPATPCGFDGFGDFDGDFDGDFAACEAAGSAHGTATPGSALNPLSPWQTLGVHGYFSSNFKFSGI